MSVRVEIDGIPYVPQPVAADEWPKVAQGQLHNGCFWVFFSDSYGVHISPYVTIRHPERQTWINIIDGGSVKEVTDPTLRTKYIAAAEAWRDKQWKVNLTIPDSPSPAKGEEPPYPRVYRWEGMGTAVFESPKSGKYIARVPGSSWVSVLYKEPAGQPNWSLLTGPEAAEYVAAAREGRDAVWPPKDADPWPHWWYSNDKTVLVRLDSPESGEWYDVQNRRWYEETDTEEWHARCGCYTRIPAPEAAALLAKWEAERKPSPPRDLPGAEEVAEKIVTKWDRDIEAIAQGIRAGMKGDIARCILQDRKARGE